MEHHRFTIEIVYGVNKPLEVDRTETVESVKVAAMGLFGIGPEERGHYVLRAKVDGVDQQLKEAQTVEFYHLHDRQKVTLASGTPFGAHRANPC